MDPVELSDSVICESDSTVEGEGERERKTIGGMLCRARKLCGCSLSLTYITGCARPDRRPCAISISCWGKEGNEATTCQLRYGLWQEERGESDVLILGRQQHQRY